MRLAALSLILALVVPGALTAEPEGPARDRQPTLVVVTGLGGEPRFDERFHAWAATLLDAASERFGLPDSHVVYLAADPDRDPDRARGRSTRDNVQGTLKELAAGMPAEAPLFLVVLGHGSYRDGVSKVNLPGPDMTAEDFATALAPFGERRIVFANLTSASGDFLRRLSGPGRVVITATRSGGERNASVFAQFFVAAFVGRDADVDQDGRLSFLEAFRYARAEVERAYRREQKLLTEHAVLDDNGDGKGSVRPAADAEDGRLAATLMLTGAPAATVAARLSDDPELRRLYERKTALEKGISELRRRKESLSREEYEDRLEERLIELALAHRAIREHEGEDGGS